MSKLPVIKPREMLKVLKKIGFVELRSKGSHIQLEKGILRVTISMHNKDIRHETMRSILRQSRMTIEELKELL